MTSVPAHLKRMAGGLAVRFGLARVVRFHRNENGSTAIEFALVAIPFIALMFAILEAALTFFAQQAMETAVQNAGRLIRTGQVQKEEMDAFAFKSRICGKIDMLFNCMGGMSMDVRRYATFDSINLNQPIDDEGRLVTDDFIYEPGTGGDIVVVRAFYEWPVFVNIFGRSHYINLANGKHLLASTAAFKNEPFPW